MSIAGPVVDEPEITIHEASSIFGIPSETLKAAIHRSDLYGRKGVRTTNGRGYVWWTRESAVRQYKDTLWLPRTVTDRRRERDRKMQNGFSAVAAPETPSPAPNAISEVAQQPASQPAPVSPNLNVSLVTVGKQAFLNLRFVSVPVEDITLIHWLSPLAGFDNTNAVRVCTSGNTEGYLLTDRYADALRDIFGVVHPARS